MRGRKIIKWAAICLVAGQLGLLGLTWLDSRRPVVDAVALGPGGVFKAPREGAHPIRGLALGGMVQVRLPRFSWQSREWLEVADGAYVRAPLAALPLSPSAAYVRVPREPLRDRPDPGGMILGSYGIGSRVDAAPIPPLYSQASAFGGDLSRWRIVGTETRPSGFIRAEALAERPPGAGELLESSGALLRSGNFRDALAVASCGVPLLEGAPADDGLSRARAALRTALARAAPAAGLTPPLPPLGEYRPLASALQRPAAQAPAVAYASLAALQIYSNPTQEAPFEAVPLGAQVEVLRVDGEWAEIRGPPLPPLGRLVVAVEAPGPGRDVGTASATWAPRGDSYPVRGFVPLPLLGSAPLDPDAVRAWARAGRGLDIAVAASTFGPGAPAPDPEWSRALVDEAWRAGSYALAARAAVPLASQARALGQLELEILEAYVGCSARGALSDELTCNAAHSGQPVLLTVSVPHDRWGMAFLHAVLRNPFPRRLDAANVTAIWMPGLPASEPDPGAARFATFEVPELPPYAGADLWVKLPDGVLELGLAAGDAERAKAALRHQRDAWERGAVEPRPEIRTIAFPSPEAARASSLPPDGVRRAASGP